MFLQGRMLGNIWAEVTFRGRKYDEPQNLGSVAFNDDYQLVAKHEETEFCNRGKAHLTPVGILPRTAPFPPLWKVSRNLTELRVRHTFNF